MSRGMFYFLVSLVIMAGLCYWGVPRIYHKFVGESLLVTPKVLMAVDSDDVGLPDGSLVSRTVVEMEISFPMGSAPESTNDLIVRDEKGAPLDVKWGQLTAKDDEDRRVTIWHLNAYFPYGFRYGRICDKVRDLAPLLLPPVPYNYHPND